MSRIGRICTAYGAQAKQGLEAVQAMTGGIQTSLGSGKKKKP